MKPKGASKDTTMFSGSVLSLTLSHQVDPPRPRGGCLPRLSKPGTGPSMKFNPHRSKPPTDNPHWHCRKGEDAHLHTR
jgi:hypothetical protein